MYVLEMKTLAYIPLQCKFIRVGLSRWFRPPTQAFGVGDTNMLVSKNLRGPNINPW